MAACTVRKTSCSVRSSAVGMICALALTCAAVSAKTTGKDIVRLDRTATSTELARFKKQYVAFEAASGAAH